MSNTFLMLQDNMTLRDLSSYVGSSNVNRVLNVNGLERTRDVYGQFKEKCQNIINTSSNVDWKRKSEILNLFSTDSDVFEYAAIQDEDGWKVLSNTMAFKDALNIPENVEIVRYDDVIGNGTAVASDVYKKVMNSLETTGSIDTTIFNDFSTIKHTTSAANGVSGNGINGLFQAFKIPWGDITFYSSLSDASVDIPAYPESIKDPRTTSYTTMPDMLYQYEPWYLYNSSGPREISLEFHLHRQMWTGDETDGRANEMIKFIQASTFPRYQGSTVNTDMCTLYIKGSPFIHGILSSAEVEWTGPIGIDGFYLEFTITLNFVEVSTRALNYDTAKELPLIGG